MSHARIALFFDGFDQGGIGRVNLTLAEVMLREGFDVDLLVFRTDGPRRDEAPVGARVIDLAGLGKLSLMVALYRYARSTPILQGIIVSNVLLAPHVGFAMRFAGRSRLPILCVHHVDMRRSINSSDGLKVSIRRWLTVAARALLGVRFAAVSEGARTGVAECLNISSAKVMVISNPVELAAPGDSIVNDTLKWWTADGVKSVLGVGRLTPEKDFECLIKAVSLLRERIAVRLLIVGYGPHSCSLEQLIVELGLSEHVRLVGFVSHPRRYYEEADVFVLSSISEAMPLSLVEAMSVGTQVVSTDCDFGPHEILDDGRFGRLVPVGDSVALAEGIFSAIDKPINSSFLITRARDFSPKKVLNYYLAAMNLA